MSTLVILLPPRTRAIAGGGEGAAAGGPGAGEVTYVVTPDASLDEVVSTMAAKKYGSAVVTDNGHVVGIFTTVDACSAFADLLGSRLSH